MDLLTQLSKTSTKPFEKIVRVFITIAAFAAIFISVAIVFTLSTEAINFFQDPEVTLKEYLQQQDGLQHFKTLCMVLFH